MYVCVMANVQRTNIMHVRPYDMVALSLWDDSVEWIPNIHLLLINLVCMRKCSDDRKLFQARTTGGWFSVRKPVSKEYLPNRLHLYRYWCYMFNMFIYIHTLRIISLYDATKAMSFSRIFIMLHKLNYFASLLQK